MDIKEQQTAGRWIQALTSLVELIKGISRLPIVKLALGIILILAGIHGAGATAYYVIKHNGSDANLCTSISSPCSTITGALGKSAAAGNIIYVLNGTYNERVDITTNWTTLTAYTGYENQSIIEGTGINVAIPDNYAGGLLKVEANYVNLSGLQVSNSQFNALRIYTGFKNTTVSNMFIYNPAAYCAFVGGDKAGPAKTFNITFSVADMAKCANGQFSESLTIEGVDGFEVKNVTLHDGGNGNAVPPDTSRGGEGMDFVNSHNGSIHDNEIYNTYLVGLYFDSGGIPSTTTFGNNTDMLIYNNKVHDTRYTTQFQIAAEVQGGTVKNLFIFNNLVYNGSGGSFAFGNYTPSYINDTQIVNNNFVGGWGVWLAGLPNYKNVSYRNNVQSDLTNNAPSVARANNWNINTQGSAGFVNSGANNYHLLNSSPLKYTGGTTYAPTFDKDYQARPQGSNNPSIGAYEYLSGGGVFNPNPPGIWNATNISIPGLRAYGDGAYVGLNLNKSYFDHLSVYYDMQETSASGKVIHNTNNETGLPNLTYQATWSNAFINNSANGQIFFNGNAFDNATVPNDGVTFSPFRTSLTVFACPNPSQVSSTTSNTIVGKFSTSNEEWRLYLENDGWFLDTYTLLGALVSQVYVNTSPFPTVNRTYCVFGTINNGTMNTLDVWDPSTHAVRSNSTTTFLENLGNGTAPLTIGSRGDSTRYFNGTVGPLLIWSNRTLSLGERLAFFNASNRLNGSVIVINQSVVNASNVITQYNVTATNLDANDNMTGYTRKNMTVPWNYSASNLTNQGIVVLDSTQQYNVTDFNITLNGNGSSTPYFWDLNWYEGSPTAPASQTFIPPQPSCTAVNGTTYINLSCTPGAGNITDGYNFSNIDNSAISNGVLPYWNETGLNSSTLFHFHVYAFNASGSDALSSPYVEYIATTYQAAYDMLPPSCTAINSTSYVNISCTPGAGNTTDGYNFTNVNTHTSHNGSASYWNNTGLSQATTYSYSIQAFNNSFGGSPSATVSYTALTKASYTPPAPVGCTAVNGTTFINITCSPGVGIVTDVMNFTNMINHASGNGTFFYFNSTGLTPSTLYPFQIYALNGTNGGTLSATFTTYNALTIAEGVSAYIPPAPSSCSAVNGTTYVVITCVAGNSSITGMNFTNTNTSQASNGALFSWNNTGLATGTIYTYYVYGFNDSAGGSLSLQPYIYNALTLTPPPAPPAPPAYPLYLLSDVGVFPHRIFKCQPVTIYANFSDYVNITSVQLDLTTTNTGLVETFNMTNLGSGQYFYNYGNDNSISWGNKTISFTVTASAIMGNTSTTNYVFVYSDPCTGTNLAGSGNISLGLGNYTSRLQSNNDFIGWTMTPYLEYWGQAFYIFILFGMCTILYMKNQKVNQALFIGFIGVAMLGTSLLIPAAYANIVLVIAVAIIGLLYWKVFKT